MKHMSLRYDGQCATCHKQTPAGTRAWWSKEKRCVYCEQCGGPNVVAPESVGVAGGSAQHEYERRRARHVQKVEAVWGTGLVGRAAVALVSEPQHVTAWKKGADGERRLSAMLRRELDNRTKVLDDLAIPGTKANIDHIVVAPSGVWVIDAKNYKGKVELRRGAKGNQSRQLFVHGRNRMTLVDKMAGQTDAIQKAIRMVPISDIPIRPALCFTNSEFPWFGGTGLVEGVWVGYGRRLIKEVSKDQVLDFSQIEPIATVLKQQLVSARQ